MREELQWNSFPSTVSIIINQQFSVFSDIWFGPLRTKDNNWLMFYGEIMPGNFITSIVRKENTCYTFAKLDDTNNKNLNS